CGSVYVVPSVALQKANVLPLLLTLVQLTVPCQWDTSIPWIAKSVPAARAYTPAPRPAAPATPAAAVRNLRREMAMSLRLRTRPWEMDRGELRQTSGRSVGPSSEADSCDC